MSYSGTTEFDFEIERYKDPKTGILYPFNKLPGDEDDYEYQTITLKIEGRSSFQEGKYTGPWENSYPSEGEIEITSAKGPDGNDWEDKLTEVERDSVVDEIDERVQDDVYNGWCDSREDYD